MIGDEEENQNENTSHLDEDLEIMNIIRKLGLKEKELYDAFT